MTRKLKFLAPTLVAALALAAATAPLSHGYSFSTEEGKEAVLDGEGIAGKETKFTFDEKHSVTCEKTGLFGLLEEPSETLLITREYEKCTAILFTVEELPTTIEDNGCKFELHLEEELKKVFFASVDIAYCEEEVGIAVNVYQDAEHKELKCSYEIVPQNGLMRVEVESGGGTPEDLVIRPNVEGMTYKRLAGNPIICGGAEGKEATYTGSTTVKGTDLAEGKPLGLFVN